MEKISLAQVERALRDEALGHFNLLGPEGGRADEVGIVRDKEQWRVYSTDERANPLYMHTYEDESDALTGFLSKVRATNQYFAARRERLQRR